MSKSILIVDDEEDVRAIAQLGLEMSTEWNVLMASSGVEGLKMALEHQPDAILLDMMMPDLDGRATLQHLKNNPKTQAIPVILVTAKVQQSEWENLATLDVAAVFGKPFRPLQLADNIGMVLGWDLNND